MDGIKLPAAYGQTRLVLLAKECFGFTKVSETAAEDTQQESFDVEVDLQSRTWYILGWSPESLYADLGLERK
jgi:hypothetical protein